MTDCTNAEMRDALPDLLHDRLTPGERGATQAHVDGCADCAAELALLRSARASFARAPQVDAAAVVRALRARPAPVAVPVPAAGRGWGGAARWRAAAAVVLLAGGGWLATTRAADDAPATEVAARPAPGVPAVGDGAGAALASREPATVASVAAATVGGLGVSVDDLSDAELDAVLRAMDGADALTPLEPLPAVLPTGIEGDA